MKIKQHSLFKDSLLQMLRSHVDSLVIDPLLTPAKKTKIINESLYNKVKELEQSNPEMEDTLTLYYAYSVVVLESRHKVWPYNQIDFSRRVGELWEMFLKKIWRLSSVKTYSPLKLSEIKKEYEDKTKIYLENLEGSKEVKEALNKYHNVLWNLIEDQNINLNSDLYFVKNNLKYVVDFKSGLGSNEKGNKSRLMSAASVYKMVGGYNCDLVVRTEEETKNYLKALKDSGLWNIHSGENYYKYVHSMTGFDLKTWIDQNINWKEDLLIYNDLKGLVKFLKW